MSLMQQRDYIRNSGDLKEFPVILAYIVIYTGPSLSTNLEVRFSA